MGFERVASLDDIEVGQAVCAVAGGVRVSLVRVEGDVVKAVHNTCSHEQYDLAPEGWVEGNRIECALHGSMFDLDTGQPDAPPATKPIPVYAAKVEDGAVYVDVAHQLNDAPVPGIDRAA